MLAVAAAAAGGDGTPPAHLIIDGTNSEWLCLADTEIRLYGVCNGFVISKRIHNEKFTFNQK